MLLLLFYDYTIVAEKKILPTQLFVLIVVFTTPIVTEQCCFVAFDALRQAVVLSGGQLFKYTHTFPGQAVNQFTTYKLSQVTGSCAS